MQKQKTSPLTILRTFTLLILLLPLCAQPGLAQETYTLYLPLVSKPGSSVTVLYASADTEIPYKLFIEYGSLENMRVGFHSTQDKAYRSLVQFPLQTLPAQCSLKYAEILLYYFRFTDYPLETRTITAYRILEPWDEMEVWFSMSELGETVGSFDIKADDSYGYRGFDATEIVSKWLNQELPNYGILFAGTGKDDPDAFRSFYTREGLHPPKLVIECGN